MKRPPVIPVEESFDKFVYQLGGKRVSDLLVDSANFQKNADYWFFTPRVILELKCFEKDLFNSEEDAERLVKLQNKWEKQGLTTGSDFIQFLFNVKPLPPECYRDMVSACRRTIESAIRKAKTQLIESRKISGLENAETLILLANDGNYFLQHPQMFSLICNLMATNFADAPISGIVYFTANMPASIRDEDREMLCWFPAYSDTANEDLAHFVNYLGEQWWSFYQSLVEQEFHPAIQLGSNFDKEISFLKSMKHLKKFKNRN